MRSPAWLKKRLERIEKDKFRCRTCWSKELLEVHHLTYDRFSNEDLDDLITLCHDCHEAVTQVIRKRRYAQRSYDPGIHTTMRFEQNDVTNERVSPTIGVTRNVAPQCAPSKSNGRVRAGTEEDNKQTKEVASRPYRNKQTGVSWGAIHGRERANHSRPEFESNAGQSRKVAATGETS